MCRKLTLIEVKEFFSSQGCELLADEYVDNTTKMPFICECGNKSFVNLMKFKIGRRCYECGNNKRKNALKYSLFEVQEIFKKNKCELLEKEYENTRQNLSYICECGNISKIRLDHFIDGHRCYECSGCKRENLDYIKNYYIKNNCVLLVDEYINCKVKMPFVCQCGNKGFLNFDKFKQGIRCKKCIYNNRSKSKMYKLFEVQEIFKKNKCELLSTEYNGSSFRMPFICECGNTSNISLKSLVRGVRCSSCYQSKGEILISQFLKSKNINFEIEKKFDSCFFQRKLPFDFFVQIENNCQFLIEFNGEHHYKPVRWSESITPKKSQLNYELVCLRDKIKIDWAKNNNFPLLVIPYWDIGKISLLIECFINENIQKAG